MTDITISVISGALTAAAAQVSLPHLRDDAPGWTWETWSADEGCWMQGGAYDTRDAALAGRQRVVARLAWEALRGDTASDYERMEAPYVIETTPGNAAERLAAALGITDDVEI